MGDRDGYAGAFEEAAGYFESSRGGHSPLYARLCRHLASEPLVRGLEGKPDPGRYLPHRLLSGAHYLVRSGWAPELAEAYAGGADPWPAFRALLETETDWLRRWLAEQPIQTNEVQRSWALLPAFLAIARRAPAMPLDLIELGASAGLNLIWDRYRLRYSSGTWGPERADLTLTGEEVVAPPASLLEATVRLRHRFGIDLDPVDVTSERGVRLLEAFVFPDHPERLATLHRAIEIARVDPPRILRGDYVEVLPRLLERREGGAVPVVFQTASTQYLDKDRRRRVWNIVETAGRLTPLAWLSTRPIDEDDEHGDGYALELTMWPGGDRRVVARMGYFGEWLEWRGIK